MTALGLVLAGIGIVMWVVAMWAFVRSHRANVDCPNCEHERRHAEDKAEKLAHAQETIRHQAKANDDLRGVNRHLVSQLVEFKHERSAG